MERVWRRNKTTGYLMLILSTFLVSIALSVTSSSAGLDVVHFSAGQGFVLHKSDAEYRRHQ